MDKAHLDHVAVFVDDICWYINFFEHTLGFKEKKREEYCGKLKQVWLDGGIQLVDEQKTQTRMAHIGILVENLPAVLKKMQQFNLKGLPKGENWLELPNGVTIELIQR
ncbi:glyoxalase [Enterococcus florum]|uniref:Glyoxalase n=1 Tax=Enterococcus florum TaxID=2480627 RepID=A0A4P5P8T2_9ENTE|nr:VOC family protein [Enterococcus florum]GCF92631.1 glyoxalase [Enterococcus florum]